MYYLHVSLLGTHLTFAGKPRSLYLNNVFGTIKEARLEWFAMHTHLHWKNQFTRFKLKERRDFISNISQSFWPLHFTFQTNTRNKSFFMTTRLNLEVSVC